MEGPLDEQYLHWLYSQVASVRVRNPARTYWSLLGQLYKTEYVWFIANDDNRVEDGRNLRYEFCEKQGISVDQDWIALSCSMLEMLIALSRRIAFEAEEGGPRDWFWEMLSNLRLQDFDDLEYKRGDSASEIHQILDRVINRRYASDGYGGLFPLREAEFDQREIELWYQMSSYLLERQYS